MIRVSSRLVQLLMMKAKRKKKRYHTGTYVSKKTGKECNYRSSWELKYLEYLDANPDVKTYEYESFFIMYVGNRNSGKLRKYIPDFLVEYVDGTRKLVEIKPSRKLDQLRVTKKRHVAEQWCKEHGAELEMVTEHELKALGLL